MAHDQYSAFKPPSRPYHNQEPRGPGTQVQRQENYYNTYPQPADSYGRGAHHGHNGYDGCGYTDPQHGAKYADMAALQQWPSQEQHHDRQDRKPHGYGRGQPPQPGRGGEERALVKPKVQAQPAQNGTYLQPTGESHQPDWPISPTGGINGASTQSYFEDSAKTMQGQSHDPRYGEGQGRSSERKPTITKVATPPLVKQGETAHSTSY